MPEKKAYDLADLISKLKAHGLGVAEDGAKATIESVIEWLSESATVSANPIDNILLAVYPMVKQFALEQADKIDGQVG